MNSAWKYGSMDITKPLTVAACCGGPLFLDEYPDSKSRNKLWSIGYEATNHLPVGVELVIFNDDNKLQEVEARMSKDNPAIVSNWKIEFPFGSLLVMLNQVDLRKCSGFKEVKGNG